jgi:hypothetical protein
MIPTTSPVGSMKRILNLGFGTLRGAIDASIFSRRRKRLIIIGSSPGACFGDLLQSFQSLLKFTEFD